MSRGVLLLDVNLLVALFHPDHVHHEIAHDWFADHLREGWATCPLTESGFIRVALQQASGDARMRPAVIFERTNPGRTMSTRTPSDVSRSPRPWQNTSSPAFDDPYT